jgi:hypothetical protein
VGSNPTPPALRILAVAVLAPLLACAGPGGDPADLTGTWGSAASDATLRVRGHIWSLSSSRLVKWGTVEVMPRRVAFVLDRTNSPAFDLYCREEVDVYDWSLDDGRLVFRTVGRPCDRAAQAVLTAGHWRRV